MAIHFATPQLELEEEQLEQDLADGLITPEEYNKQMRELQRAYREEAEEAAEEAYWREMENW